MSVFIRRFLFDPGNTVLLNIESVNILDLIPPASITGVGTGTVMIVGEFENGPFNTPYQLGGTNDLTTNFGSLGYTYNGVQGNNPCAVARYADMTLAAEYWNGNAFVQLNGKQFAQLVVVRANTSVGNVQFSPRAYVTGTGAFRFVLFAGAVLGLDVGAGPQTATFSATAGTVTSVAATYAMSAGNTVTLGYDGAPNFTATFLATDTTQAAVIARINQYAGFAMAATSGGQFSLTGLQQGYQANVRVVSASGGGVLTALGLAVGTTYGTGNVANILSVTSTEINTVISTAITNTAVEIDGNGNLRISKTTAAVNDYVYVTAATTALALGFTPGQFGANNGVGFVLSSAGTYPTGTAGTLTLAIDDNFAMQSTVNQGQPFTVTITLTAAIGAVVAAINTAAGKTIAYVDGTNQIALFGFLPGGRVNIIAGTPAVLTELGLALGIYTGPGLPSGLIPAGTIVQDSTAAHVMVTMQDVVFSSSGVTIGQFGAPGAIQLPSAGPWPVPIRHAVDNTQGLAATAGTLTVVPYPPGVISVAAVNTQNTTAALTDAQIDAQYVNALNSTLDLNTVAAQVNIAYSARQSNTVRNAMRTNALNASANGCFGRMAIIRPPLGTTKQTAMLVNATPGVGATRDQRVVYCWPAANTFVPIIGQIGTAGGLGFTSTGNVDVGADGFLASIMSQLPPEENPGQDTPFTTAINSLESSPNAAGLMITDYIALKNAGICALRFDSGTAIYQSGVTSVDPNVYPSLTRISRRRMADYIQDSVALLAKSFGKKLSTYQRRKALASEIRSFMAQLLNSGNPNGGQRIAGYTVDDVTGNTTTTLAMGLFRIILNVQTLASLDSIVIQTTIGEQVQVQEIFVPAQAA
jgi:hypothetical protein